MRAKEVGSLWVDGEGVAHRLTRVSTEFDLSAPDEAWEGAEDDLPRITREHWVSFTPLGAGYNTDVPPDVVMVWSPSTGVVGA